jgi:ribonuclease R
MEGLATNAERDSIKYMQVKYMQDHQDQEFLGVISGVTEWGIYVEIIETNAKECEFERYKTIITRRKQYALTGATSVLQLGDEIYVKVKNADLVKNNWILIFKKNGRTVKIKKK